MSLVVIPPACKKRAMSSESARRCPSLSHRDRVEGALTVPRRTPINRLGLRLSYLAGQAVVGIARHPGLRSNSVGGQVVGNLRIQHSLDRPFEHVRQQPSRTRQLRADPRNVRAAQSVDGTEILTLRCGQAYATSLTTRLENGSRRQTDEFQADCTADEASVPGSQFRG